MTNLPQQLPDVARSFTQFCKKCNEDRLHKVLAHVNDKSAKVECEICKKKSTFKLATVKKPAKAKSAAGKAKVPTPRGPNWDELTEKLNAQKARPYRVSETFAVDHVIEHPKFGTGLVLTATIDRIEAIFREGSKTLIHGMKSA